jgi:hypothetical protein
MWPWSSTGRTKIADEVTALRETVSGQEETIAYLRENLAELELALDDVGWLRMGLDSSKEFSREGLRKINALARIFWLKNPLVKRAVLIQTQYVFGQGVNIEAKHDKIDEVVQAFLDDKKNQAELTSHQSYSTKEMELQIFANLFFVFFVNNSTGRVRVRSINPDEIEDIVYNPDDGKDPWYYKRTWTRKGLNASTGQWEIKTEHRYYPDWRYNPAGGHPAIIGGIKVEVDSPVYHVAVNKLSDMKFGVSEVYAAIDWAKAYKGFLEDWASIVKAYARFAWEVRAPGGSAQVQAIKDKFNTGVTSSSATETNPPPLVGASFISGKNGPQLAPVRTAGATTAAEDGRRLLLMVAAATGIYEHYFGDPSTGNLATAKSMERPMELMFRDRQQLWKDVLHDIIEFVIDQAVKAPSGKLNGLGRVDQDEDGEEVIVMNDDTDNEDEDLRGKPIDRHVDINFPDLLEKDIVARVDAIVKATTLAGGSPAGTIPDIKYVTRLLLVALGEENVDEILAKMFPEGWEAEWDEKYGKQPVPQFGDGQVPGEDGEGGADEPKRMFAEAVKQLREAVSRLAHDKATD